MTLSEITNYVNQLVKEGFSPDNSSFTRYPLYFRNFYQDSDINKETIYKVEIGIDPKSICLFINKFKDKLDLDLAIKLNYSEPIMISAILEDIKSIYEKLEKKTIEFSVTNFTHM